MKRFRREVFVVLIVLAAIALFGAVAAHASSPPSFDPKPSITVPYPERIAQDLDGNLYVSDSRKGKVTVFDKYGHKVREVDSIAKPAAVATDRTTGVVYVASPDGVFVLGENGQAHALVGKSDPSAPVGPVDMAVDSGGNIYVVDGTSRLVRVYSVSGVHLADFGGADPQAPCYPDCRWIPMSIAIGPDSVSGEEVIFVGYAFMALDSNNDAMVMVYDASYRRLPGRSFGVPFVPDNNTQDTPGRTEITAVAGLAMDENGRIYVTDPYGDTHGGRVLVFEDQGRNRYEYAVASGSTTTQIVLGAGEGANISVGDYVYLDPDASDDAIYSYSGRYPIRIGYEWNYEEVSVAAVNGDVLTVMPALSVAPPEGRSLYAGVYELLTGESVHAVLYDMYGRLFVTDATGTIRIYSVDGNNVPNVAPTAPYFISPLGRIRIATSSPTLVAGNSYDVNGDALEYKFEVASDVGMMNMVWESQWIPEGRDGTTSVVVGAVLQENTDYYWRVRSSDGLEASTYSMTTAFFVNVENSAPVFDVLSPGDARPSIEAGKSLAFAAAGHDPDRDSVTVTWVVDGAIVANGGELIYDALLKAVGEHVVRAEISDGNLSSGHEWIVTVNRPNTAPSAPGINAPAGGADIIAPVLSVNNSSDAEADSIAYTFDISKTGSFSEDDIIVAISGVSEGRNITSVEVSDKLADNTLYYWRAVGCEVPRDGDYVAAYYCSEPSETASFFLNTQNDAPGAPGISYPSAGSHVVSLNPTLTVTNALDVDINDILTYDFEIAADSRFVASVMRKSAVDEGSGGSTSIFVGGDGILLEDNRFYYWRVRAIDDKGSSSGWIASSFFVNTANDAPTTPVAAAPSNGSETASTPMLAVYNSVDADGDSIGYIFEIDDTNTFGSEKKQTSGLVAGGLDRVSWTVPSALSENTTYYWRAKATDGSAVSAWSEVSTLFVNSVNDAPAAPTVKTPKNGTAVNVSSPDLAVYAARDVDNDELEYIYQVSATENFGTIVTESGLAGAVWTVDMALDENGHYFWRARAVDEHGLSGPWSGASAFMINIANDPPSAPVVASGSAVSGVDIILKIGNSFDVDSGTLWYAVEVYADRDLTRLVYSEDGLTERREETTCNIGSLRNGLYYWRARAYDGVAYGSWSTTAVLLVKNGDAGPDSSPVELGTRTLIRRFR